MEGEKGKPALTLIKGWGMEDILRAWEWERQTIFYINTRDL